MKIFTLIVKKIYLAFALIVMTWTGIASPQVYAAFSNTDLNDILRKHPYYSAEGCEVSTSTNLLGSDNTEIGFRYFVSKGLQPIHAAAITGNFAYESGGLNPASFNPAGGGQGAYGIAQWRAERQTALKRKANYHTLPVQLDHAWEELHSNRAGALPNLQKETLIENATITFERDFEGSGGAGNTTRIKNAKDILETYGKSTSVTTPSTIGSAQDCSGIVGSGQDTKFVDGFAVFSQTDPDWKDLPYGGSTIGISGCGPTAMAMIITALTGKTVTPVEAADFAASQNLYILGVGSSWSIGPVLAERWGLKATSIGPDIGNIAATLQSGGLVIAPGQGAKPFTSEGHFIVIRGITAGGKFKVGDSAHADTSDKEWDPEQIVANMRSGGVYAITAQ